MQCCTKVETVALLGLHTLHVAATLTFSSCPLLTPADAFQGNDNSVAYPRPGIRDQPGISEAGMGLLSIQLGSNILIYVEDGEYKLLTFDTASARYSFQPQPVRGVWAGKGFMAALWWAT